MMTVADSIKAQLDEVEHVIRAQMARIAELEAELERLRSAAGAHDVLREIYANANQPTGHRIKAAGIAIGHEVPKIQSVPPPLELSAEEAVPLAQLVEQRRARQNELCPQSADLHQSRCCPLLMAAAATPAAMVAIGTASNFLHSGKLSCVVADCSALRLGSPWEAAS